MRIYSGIASDEHDKEDKEDSGDERVYGAHKRVNYAFHVYTESLSAEELGS
jgi:hypothetical protein